LVRRVPGQRAHLARTAVFDLRDPHGQSGDLFWMPIVQA
jgi:hypothetical protein